MTNVVEIRLLLAQEVHDLTEKEKKHFTVLRATKEGQRLAELRQEEADKKITDGEAAWKTEQETWKKEKADLTMAKTGDSDLR